MEQQQERGGTASRVQATRPEGRPADDRKKERANAVYAAAGGKIFEIPLDVAQKYAVSGDRAKELQCLVPQGIGEEGAEVGGRDMRGGVFHPYWAHGAYIWWRDLEAYRGWHWHPYPNNFLAYDVDD